MLLLGAAAWHLTPTPTPTPAPTLAPTLALTLTPQALLRWALLRGTSVVPKSVTPARIRENAAAMRPPPPGPNQIGEAEALAALDSALRVAQARRVTGAYFVGTLTLTLTLTLTNPNPNPNLNPNQVRPTPRTYCRVGGSIHHACQR